MNTRPLGKTGLRLSVVGFGTNQLRRVPERDAVRALLRAFELGIDLVNVEPEYEGADELVATALRARGDGPPIHVSAQAGGHLDAFERAFETLCETLGRGRIDLFGITSISDAELHRCDVWGPRGVVEYLQRKKEEGRVGALFASDHGTPEQTKALLERDVFDALLLAWNPLGFHLESFRAETVYRFEQPPPALPPVYRREDLARTGSELLPLAKARGVGILVMKPLAGGLLASARAFPSRPWRPDLPAAPRAGDVLRHVLANEAITSVVPGMACVEEVEENAAAGTGDLRLGAEAARAVGERAAALARTLCSRCGACDDRCSRGLPVSFLFRAAYHYLFPSVPFAVSRTLQYFRLHAADGDPCLGCADRTCACPAGLDIPSELAAIHRKMLELRRGGIVPDAAPVHEDWTTGRRLSAHVLSRELPDAVAAGGSATVRLHVRNTGRRTWRRRATLARCRVALAVSIDGRRRELVRLRADVPPQQECHFAARVAAPVRAGVHTLRLALVLARGELVVRELLRIERTFRTAGEPAPKRPGPLARLARALRPSCPSRREDP